MCAGVHGCQRTPTDANGCYCVCVQHHRVLFSSGKRIESETMGDVKPGTCIELPGWAHFRHAFLPALDALLGDRLGVKDWESRLLRMQINLMPKGSTINPHRDSGECRRGRRSTPTEIQVSVEGDDDQAPQRFR
jgi:hypothetical protein